MKTCSLQKELCTLFNIILWSLMGSEILATHYNIHSGHFKFECERGPKFGPIAQLRLERTPDKREVSGSTPLRPTVQYIETRVKS